MDVRTTLELARWRARPLTGWALTLALALLTAGVVHGLLRRADDARAALRSACSCTCTRVLVASRSRRVTASKAERAAAATSAELRSRAWAHGVQPRRRKVRTAEAASRAASAATTASAGWTRASLRWCCRG